MTDFVDMIFFHADANPDKAAVITGDSILTYAKLRQGILSVQQKLRQYGLKPGDRAAIAVTSAVGHVTLICALHRAGIASVSIDQTQLEYLDDLALDAVLTNAPVPKGAAKIVTLDDSWFEGKDLLDAGPAPAAPWDDESPCRLILSSGTTGRPKTIALSYEAVQERLISYAIRVSTPSWDRLVCMLGISTNFGYSFAVTALWLGRTICFAYDATARQLVLSYQAELLVGSTHQIAALVQFQEQNFMRLDSLRAVHLGGAVAYAPMQARIRTLVCDLLYCGYGSTEGGTVAYVPAELIFGMDRAVGIAAPWLEIEVLNEQREKLPYGEQGEVRIRALGQGFRSTEAGETEETDAEGWFYPGDQGVCYRNGLLLITGRIDELINRGGVKVAPELIEEEIKKHPAIADAAAVGMLDAVGIEQIWLAIAARDGQELDVKQLYDYCRDHMPTTVPDRIFQVAAIPRNQTGKVSRAPLTEQLKTLESGMALAVR